MKQLRKAMALLLALILALSVSAGALAAPGTGLRGEQNNVTVVVKGVNGDPAVVYHVVIAWDALTFTYDFGEQSSVWDTTNHQYQTTTGTVGWDKTTANITITNHSNAAVNYAASFASSSSTSSVTVDGVTATLGTPSGNVDTADQAPYRGTTNAPGKTVTVTISDTAPTTKQNRTFEVGTIYLTISAA